MQVLRLEASVDGGEWRTIREYDPFAMKLGRAWLLVGRIHSLAVSDAAYLMVGMQIEEKVPKNWPQEKVRLRWRYLNQDEFHFFYLDQIKLVGDSPSDPRIASGTEPEAEALGMSVQPEVLENTNQWFGTLSA